MMNLPNIKYYFYDISNLERLRQLQVNDCKLYFFIGKNFFRGMPKELSIKVFTAHKINIFLFCEKEEDIEIILFTRCSPHISLQSNLRTHISLRYVGDENLHIPRLTIGKNCIIREITGISNVCNALWNIKPTEEEKDISLDTNLNRIYFKSIHVNVLSPLRSLTVNASKHRTIMVTGDIKNLVIKLHRSKKVIIENNGMHNLSTIYANVPPDEVYFRGFNSPKFYKKDGKEEKIITKEYIPRISSKKQPQNSSE
jgi:hypothetical protein